MDEKQQKCAADGEVFHEQDHLHLLAEIAVENNCGEQGESGQQYGSNFSLVTY
jgi:hypothetical protein